MTLIPYRSLFDLDRLFDDEFIPLMRPSMDIYEKGSNVVAELHIPGIDPAKIDVSVKEGILHVSGASAEKKEEKEKGYWRKEIRTGSFERMVRLPVPVREDKTEATYENGILIITMPKAGEKPQRKVQVKAKRSAPKKIRRA